MRRLLERFKTVVVLDLETTGVSFSHDQVIELGAVRWDGGEVTEEVEDLISLAPGTCLPPQITELTGITEQMLSAQGVSKQTAAVDVRRLLQGEDRLVVTYNAQFDLNFLYHFLRRYGDPAWLQGIQMLDALTVYRDRRPYPHRLENAIAAYGLEDSVVNSHRAVDDARAAAQVLRAMEEEKADLERYINLFGYHPRYGVSGRRIRSVRYLPQFFGSREPLYAQADCPAMTP